MKGSPIKIKISIRIKRRMHTPPESVLEMSWFCPGFLCSKRAARIFSTIEPADSLGFDDD